MRQQVGRQYAAPDGGPKPPEPWCVGMALCETHCPMCASPGMIRISKAGRPYFSCRFCYTRLFMNSERATRNFRFADGYFAAFEKIIRSKLGQNYRRTIDLGAGSASKSILIERAENLSDSYAEGVKITIRRTELETREAILNAGRSCILCSGLSEWRQARKGHFQNCRFCCSQVFINSPLGLAGLMTRREILRAMHQYNRERAAGRSLRVVRRAAFRQPAHALQQTTANSTKEGGREKPAVSGRPRDHDDSR
jgi:hypothetical protein